MFSGMLSNGLDHSEEPWAMKLGFLRAKLLQSRSSPRADAQLRKHPRHSAFSRGSSELIRGTFGIPSQRDLYIQHSFTERSIHSAFFHGEIYTFSIPSRRAPQGFEGLFPPSSPCSSPPLRAEHLCFSSVSSTGG